MNPSRTFCVVKIRCNRIPTKISRNDHERMCGGVLYYDGEHGVVCFCLLKGYLLKGANTAHDFMPSSILRGRICLEALDAEHGSRFEHLPEF